MPRLILVGVSISPFVGKVRRALAYKGLEAEAVRPRSPAEMRRWNPQTRKMPVLEIDGERVADSTRIFARLDELAPAPPLYARDVATRSRQRLLEDWADEGLYWYLMALRWTDANAPATEDQLCESLGVPALARPLARHVLRRQVRGLAVAQGLARSAPDDLISEFDARMTDLAGWLGDGAFLAGDAASAPDLAVAAQITSGLSGPTPEFERALDAHPSLAAWLQRVDAATGA